MKIRNIARVITYDKKTNKILLVKNKGTEFWYAPGGEWEHDKENILEAACREVKEEAGMSVNIKKLLYVQEFHATEDTIFFETFWLAELVGDQTLNDQHIDLDPNGQVEQARWFDKEKLQDLKIFPKRLKNTFWDNISRALTDEDPFIGIS